MCLLVHASHANLAEHCSRLSVTIVFSLRVEKVFFSLVLFVFYLVTLSALRADRSLFGCFRRSTFMDIRLLR